MLQRTWHWLVLSGVALLVAMGIVAVIVPSGDYLYVPNPARPVAERVKVEGERSPDATGGVYYVDVTLKRARWLDRIAPFARPDGASLVPSHAVTAPGQTFRQRIAAARTEMNRSEEIAAAVALEAAGLAVDAEPRGALIESVAVDVPAAATLESGDVIVEAAGQPVLTPGALRNAVEDLDPGDEVRLRLRRNGKPLERTIRTIAAPDDERRTIIGVSVSQIARIRLPLDVEIDLGDVGGPSAGLPFALEIFQALGNDVDRGYRVAATGKVELDGSVTPVGGIKQKTFGVRSADADVFLVPAGENAATARRYAGGLRVIGVETFAEALRVLKTLPDK
ncbi:MAG: PDZ domain-containing protein [Actinobacteria bacterium]|nr:PDZ domain-containing protein [Actinomycetota bacterium]